MLAELVTQDHRQKARASPSSRDDVEGCRRLADLLTVTAGELFPHCLNDFPTARHAFHRFGDIFTELAKPFTATASAGYRPRHNNTLTRQMLGKWFLDGPFAGKASNCNRSGRSNGHFGRKLIFGSSCLGILKHQFHLRNQPRSPFRLLTAQLPLQLFDTDFLAQNDGLIVGLLGLGHSQLS